MAIDPLKRMPCHTALRNFYAALLPLSPHTAQDSLTRAHCPDPIDLTPRPLEEMVEEASQLSKQGEHHKACALFERCWWNLTM